MFNPFFGIGLKTQRAHDQLKTLQSKIDAFVARQSYEIVTEVNPNALEIYSVVKERHPIDSIWSIVIGEIVHDFRSALDHLVWQLVIKETGAPPTTNKTQFPIFETLAGYESCGEPALLNGVGAKAKAIIKSLQPFDTGEGHQSPLWHLHELSNWDKHRRIPLTAATQRALAIEALKDEVESIGITPSGVPIKDDTVLGTVRLKPSDLPFMDRIAKVKMKTEFSYHITFQEPTVVAGPQVVHELNSIGQRVGKILKRIDNECFYPRFSHLALDPSLIGHDHKAAR